MKTSTYFLSIFLCLFFMACNSSETADNTTKDNTNVKPNVEKKAFVKKGYQVGDMVESFTLMNIDDKEVSLSDYSDKEGAIVIFSCNTCPVVVDYEDRIVDLHKTFEAKGYPVVAINPNDPEIRPGDSFDKMKERAKEKNFSFAYLFDEKQEVFPLWGATRTPEVYVLKNVENGMKVVYTGAIDDNQKNASAVKNKYVENAIQAVLNGNTPDPNFTKAIGCSIKYKKES